MGCLLVGELGRLGRFDGQFMEILKGFLVVRGGWRTRSTQCTRFERLSYFKILRTNHHTQSGNDRFPLRFP